MVAAQLPLFGAPTLDALAWQAWVPKLARPHGRGGYQTMLRLPGDPVEQGRRGGAHVAERLAAFKALRGGDPARFMSAIETLLHADGKPRSFNALSVLLVDKHADLTCGGPLEEAVWRCVAGASVRWAVHEPSSAILFAAWRLGDDLQTPPRAHVLDERWTFTRKDT